MRDLGISKSLRLVVEYNYLPFAPKLTVRLHMIWMLLLTLGWPIDGPVAIIPPLPLDHARRLVESGQLFETKVAALLKQNCLKCHGGEKTMSGFDLTTREGLLAGGDNGIAVIPFAPKESRLLRLVRHAEEPFMPGKGQKLPIEVVDTLVKWIELGAAYSKPLTDKPMKPKTLVVTPKDRAFWSFGPIRPTKVPTDQKAPTDQNGWIQNPIDSFILDKLKANQTQPNPRATKELLIRRLALDLTGLPPTPETLDRVSKDNRPTALKDYAKELLTTVAYGERWGRHWLDVARFAESHGYEQDYDRPHAWPYRDWVIRSIQNDLPYDKFVAWQIAGDELSPGDTDAFLATGFLGAGVHATQITKNQVEKERYDELDDIVRTIGAGMLGLSINCARCHDHKYDPVPMVDYYRLLSTFTKTVRSDQDLPIADPQFSQKLAAWEKSKIEATAALTSFDLLNGPKALDKWKAMALTDKRAPGWSDLLPTMAQSQNGATLTLQANGKIQSQGKNPAEDTYTLQVTTPLEKIRQFRIEVFADKALVGGGPGRANNGNFSLSNLKVSALPLKPLANVRYQPVVLKLVKPRATFEQKGLSLASAIDGDSKSGWAIDPQFGKDHVGAFEVQDPPEFPGGTKLVIVLEFKTNTSHTFGTFRIGISDHASPLGLKDGGLPIGARDLLQGKPIDKATEASVVGWLLSEDANRIMIISKIQEMEKAKPVIKTVKALVCSEGLPAIRLHTQGGDFLEETHYLKRGDPNQKGEIATQGFLQVLSATGKETSNWQKPMPKGSKTQGQRANLARWLTDEKEGAGGLLARVVVNRLWHHHFGRGFVPTVNDFGFQGDRPSHPELLEWLAGELIRSGWSLRHIHLLIVSSATYQQTGSSDAARKKVDPTNVLLWRFAPRRLEAEVVRDSMLAVSGRLEPVPFGAGTMDPNHRRRSIYFFLKRSALPADLMVFDAPDTLQIAEARAVTTVAPQALFLLNGRMARECAVGIGQSAESKLKATPAFISATYLRVLGRLPSKMETSTAIQFLAMQEKALATEGVKDSAFVARTDFAHTLLQLNEFLFLP